MKPRAKIDELLEHEGALPSGAAAARLAASLDEVLEEASNAYHQDDTPIMDDADYDRLIRLQKALIGANPSLTSSVIGRVGAAPARGFAKIRHAMPMLSLANAFDEGDIREFDRSIRDFLGIEAAKDEARDMISYFAEPKIDGLSLSLRYEHGKLIHAATRGNGVEGEDVTKNARTITDIPPKIADARALVEIRGEVYMRRDDFARFNAEEEKAGRKQAANPRNAAAGSLRQKDASITKSRPLRFIAYAWGEMSAPHFTHQSLAHEQLARWGFAIDNHARICQDIAALLAYYDEIAQKRADIPYDIDGVVFKIDEVALQNRLGFRSTTPRWAIAHKLPSETAFTRLLAIDLQIGRTGALSPVARLEPVSVGGVVVSNATLHNEDYIAGRDSKGAPIREGRDIREGDMVEVYRAGDVIPKINDVLIEKRPAGSVAYEFPKTCPKCHSPVIREKGEAVHYCTGRLICEAQAIEALKHFVSRDALNIEGLGARQIELFWEKGWVRKFGDIFALQNHKAALLELEGYGETSINNLLQSIENARNIPFDRLLFALGIRHVGASSARDIARHIGSYDKLGELVNSPDALAELTAIDGIGENTAQSIMDMFANEAERAIIDALATELSIEKVEAIEAKSSPISGKSVVFTGNLAKMTRAEAKVRAEELGARVSSSISAKTDFLVAGPGAGSKLKKAGELEVRILDEEAWLALISGEGPGAGEDGAA